MGREEEEMMYWLLWAGFLGFYALMLVFAYGLMRAAGDADRDMGLK